ncbi:hypothetical protein SE92_03735 [Bradyrhizobium sp. AT1]|nr:hypothetical protein SE92_03735 [Bradyrhizobium sp. AT1]
MRAAGTEDDVTEIGFERRSSRGAVFFCVPKTRPGHGDQSCPGLATGDALGDVASVRIAETSARDSTETAAKLEEQADARLTDRRADGIEARAQLRVALCGRLR